MSTPGSLPDSLRTRKMESVELSPDAIAELNLKKTEVAYQMALNLLETAGLKILENSSITLIAS